MCQIVLCVGQHIRNPLSRPPKRKRMWRFFFLSLSLSFIRDQRAAIVEDREKYTKFSPLSVTSVPFLYCGGCGNLHSDADGQTEIRGVAVKATTESNDGNKIKKNSLFLSFVNKTWWKWSDRKLERVYDRFQYIITGKTLFKSLLLTSCPTANCCCIFKFQLIITRRGPISMYISPSVPI